MSEVRRFGPLPRVDMSPEQEEIAQTILTGPRGGSELHGPFEAFLRSPGVAAAAQRLGAHVRYRSAIPLALNEMAILLVARRWTAQYEWFAHRPLADAAGLDPSIVEAIAIGRRPDLEHHETAVFEFVTQLLDAGAVTDSAWEAVTQRWDKRGAMDLIALVGYYTLVSLTLNVDRYPVPAREPPPLPPSTCSGSWTTRTGTPADE